MFIQRLVNATDCLDNQQKLTQLTVSCTLTYQLGVPRVRRRVDRQGQSGPADSGTTSLPVPHKSRIPSRNPYFRGLVLDLRCRWVLVDTWVGESARRDPFLLLLRHLLPLSRVPKALQPRAQRKQRNIMLRGVARSQRCPQPGTRQRIGQRQQRRQAPRFHRALGPGPPTHLSTSKIHRQLSARLLSTSKIHDRGRA